MRESRVSGAMAALYAAVMAVVGGIAVLAYDQTAFYAKAYRGGFLCSNIALSCAALMGIALVRAGMKRQARTLAGEEPKGIGFLLCAPVVLFAVQVYVGYHTYAMQSGDVQRILETSFMLGRGEMTQIHDPYYEVYPNNIFLTCVFSGVMKLLMALGMEPGLERFSAILMVLQSGVSMLACLCALCLCRMMTGQRAAVWLYFIGYALLVGLSGWYTAPYSDSMALVLPVGTILVDHLCRRHAHTAARRAAFGAAIGLMGALAMMIKPQSAVAFLAIVLCDLAFFAAGRLKNIRAFAAKMLAMLCVFGVVSGPVGDGIAARSGLAGDEEKRISVLHYLYMGLNPYTNGSYASWDRITEAEFPQYEERSEAYKLRIAQRVDGMNAGDWLRHLLKKCLVNFSDGTFAWGYDGYRPVGEKDPKVSPWLRSFMWGDGENRIWLATLQQTVWLGVLMLCPLCMGTPLRGKQGENDARMQTMTVMQTAALGIVAFNMLFEARARYVYVMAPVLLLLAVLAVTADHRKKV